MNGDELRLKDSYPNDEYPGNEPDYAADTMAREGGGHAECCHGHRKNKPSCDDTKYDDRNSQHISEYCTRRHIRHYSRKPPLVILVAPRI